MGEEPKSTPGERFLLASEMADFGIALMRQNLRKRFPDETEAQIDARLGKWLEGPDPSAKDLKVRPWPK